MRRAAHHRALERFGYLDCDCDPSLSHRADEEGEEENVALGTDIGAAAASFSFFASGALVPILPYIFGLSGLWAMALSLLFVAMALGFTGGIVGLLSGSFPDAPRAAPNPYRARRGGHHLPAGPSLRHDDQLIPAPTDLCNYQAYILHSDRVQEFLIWLSSYSTIKKFFSIFGLSYQ